MTREDKVDTGLDALLGPKAASAGVSRPLPISSLFPATWQPRLHIDETRLHQLADSIRARGVLQPLVVRPHPTKSGAYEIVMGERRWRAAQVAALKEVPCVIKPLDDDEAHVMSAVENLQREDLTRLEDVLYKLTLAARVLGCTRTEAPAQLKAAKSSPGDHKSAVSALTRLFSELGGETWESYVANGLPMLDISEDLLDLVRQRQLAPRLALLIHRADPSLKAELVTFALSGATVAQVQARIDEAGGRSYTGDVQALRKNFTPKRIARLDSDRRERVLALMRQLDELLR